MSKSFMHIVDWFKLERLLKVKKKKSRNYVRQTFTHPNQSLTLSSDSKQQLGGKKQWSKMWDKCMVRLFFIAFYTLLPTKKQIFG